MFQSIDVASGVKVVSVKTDSYKTNIIDVSMAVPMGDDNAVNALLIHLLKRSCKEYPDFTELNGKLDELYGASLGAGVSKNGDAQVLSLSITCIDDKFSFSDENICGECAKLIAGMVFNPNVKSGSFGVDNLNLEKRLLIQEVLEEKDDKRSYALKKCVEAMCENEPYGRPRVGTVEQIEKVKMAEVYAAWKNLLSTALFQITVVGNTDGETIANLFAEKFKKIDRQPCKIETVFLKKPRRFMRYEEREPVNQGKLVMGYRAGMENAEDCRYAETVMVDIFGGGTYSKLFANIREKMSLAYYCSARLVASKGIILVQSGIDTDKEKAVSAGVINQLNDVRKGKFEDETIAASKRSIKEGLAFTTPESYCAWYSTQILKSEIITPEEFAENIEKVTKEEICAAASRMCLDKIFMLVAEPEEEDDKNED